MKKTVAWLRTEKALKTLTIIILAAGILDFLSGFLTYNYSYGDYILVIGSSRFLNLLSNLLTLAPKVLLALYVFYFRSKWNPTFFRFIFLTAIACGSLLSIISIVPRQLVNGMIFYALISKTIMRFLVRHSQIIRPWGLKMSISECLITYSIPY